MHALLTPSQIEIAARRNGLSIKEVCSRAGIAISTFTRWRQGKTTPRIDVYERLLMGAGIMISKDLQHETS